MTKIKWEERTFHFPYFFFSGDISLVAIIIKLCSVLWAIFPVFTIRKKWRRKIYKRFLWMFISQLHLVHIIIFFSFWVSFLRVLSSFFLCVIVLLLFILQQCHEQYYVFVRMKRSNRIVNEFYLVLSLPFWITEKKNAVVNFKNQSGFEFNQNSRFNMVKWKKRKQPHK